MRKGTQTLSILLTCPVPAWGAQGGKQLIPSFHFALCLEKNFAQFGMVFDQEPVYKISVF